MPKKVPEVRIRIDNELPVYLSPGDQLEIDCQVDIEYDSGLVINGEADFTRKIKRTVGRKVIIERLN